MHGVQSNKTLNRSTLLFDLHVGIYSSIKMYCILVIFPFRIPVLQGTEDFTVLIKNQIFFPIFRVRRYIIFSLQKKKKIKINYKEIFCRRNILDAFAKNTSYLSSCLYHPLHDPFCPIFRLGDIIALAQENYSAIAVKGAVIGFVIEWDCNLDLSVEYCLPKYSFRRIDNAEDVVAKGWNFR